MRRVQRAQSLAVLRTQYAQLLRQAHVFRRGVRQTRYVEVRSALSPEVADPRPRVPAWFVDVVAGVFVVACIVIPAPFTLSESTSTLSTLLVLTPLLVLPWRRKSPRWALVALLTLFALTASSGTLSPGIAGVAGLSLYEIASRGPRTHGIVLGVVTAAFLVLASYLAPKGTVFGPHGFQFALVIAFFTAAGDGARLRRNYIIAIRAEGDRKLEATQAQAQRRITEERLKIARDLHDVVAHQIAVISLNAGVASAAVDTRPEKAKEALGTVRGAARTVLSEIGDLMALLRSSGVEDQLLAPQPDVSSLPLLVESFRAAGMDVQLEIDATSGSVSEAVGLVAFKVVQEGLTNAHKHAASRRASVRVREQGKSLVVTVESPDAGGFGAAGTGGAGTASVGAGGAGGAAGGTLSRGAGSGFGIIGLQERAASVRGSVTASSAQGLWTLEARLPISKEDIS